MVGNLLPHRASFQLSGDEVAPRPEVAVAADLEAIEIVTSFTTFVDAKDQAHGRHLELCPVHPAA